MDNLYLNLLKNLKQN